MTQIDAVFERGVFRPIEPIDLPERTRVTVAVPDSLATDRSPEVREILARRHSSGIEDTAARHNEHQP